MPEQKMQLEMPIKIKNYDVDAMGYVSNIVYVRWFEDLRHLMLDKYYPFDRMIAEDCSPVLARTEVDYKKPLTIHDKPSGRMWMVNMGVTKWTIGFEIFQGDHIHCRGTQTGYFMNLKSGRPERMPESLTSAFSA